MRNISFESQLTDEHKSVIRRGALNGDDWQRVHEQASDISPVTQKLVKKMMEQYAQDVALKSEAKKEGSRLVHEFLQKALSGIDVDDMIAALEHALYRDILRRYADAGDALVSMTMEQVLKMELTYRGSHFTQKKRATDFQDSGQVAKLSGQICVEMYQKLGMLVDKKTMETLEKQKQSLLVWMAEKFGKDNITEILNEQNEIERLRELMGKKPTRNNGSKAEGKQKLVGLVG